MARRTKKYCPIFGRRIHDTDLYGITVATDLMKYMLENPPCYAMDGKTLGYYAAVEIC